MAGTGGDCLMLHEQGRVTLGGMRRIAPDVPMEDIFRGVVPLFVVILLLVPFPALALWLPSLMP